MTVELIDRWPTDLQAAVGKVVAVLDSFEELELPEGAVNIMLVNDEEISELNAQYSGNNYPTDVLTFAYPEENDELDGDDEDSEYSVEDGELADIVISSETAERQAAASGTTLADEIALLALHGILHALGLDHQSQEDRDTVDRIQAEIMTAAGRPYRNFEWTH